jgi:hypothetical protein
MTNQQMESRIYFRLATEYIERGVARLWGVTEDGVAASAVRAEYRRLMDTVNKFTWVASDEILAAPSDDTAICVICRNPAGEAAITMPSWRSRYDMERVCGGCIGKYLDQIIDEVERKSE